MHNQWDQTTDTVSTYPCVYRIWQRPGFRSINEECMHNVSKAMPSSLDKGHGIPEIEFVCPYAGVCEQGRQRGGNLCLGGKPPLHTTSHFHFSGLLQSTSASSVLGWRGTQKHS
jgi:hypothetical protein